MQGEEERGVDEVREGGMTVLFSTHQNNSLLLNSSCSLSPSVSFLMASFTLAACSLKRRRRGRREGGREKGGTGTDRTRTVLVRIAIILNGGREG